MDFSEFRRLLGADPRNQDPAFLEARAASPEFRDASVEADRFEDWLERALALEIPPDLLDRIREIPRKDESPAHRAAEHGTWWRFAVAASLLLAVGAAGLTWRMNTGWNSVDDYVVDHYQHDGLAVLAMADDPRAADVSGMLAEFGATMTPALAGIVSVVKKCPTPDGKGVHMVLNTERGLVTVIYMPETPVSDGEQILFDDSEAVLVQLRHGSAVIIGSRLQNVSEFRSLVQESIVTADGNT